MKEVWSLDCGELSSLLCAQELYRSQQQTKRNTYFITGLCICSRIVLSYSFALEKKRETTNSLSFCTGPVSWYLPSGSDLLAVAFIAMQNVFKGSKGLVSSHETVHSYVCILDQINIH